MPEQHGQDTCGRIRLLAVHSADSVRLAGRRHRQRVTRERERKAKLCLRARVRCLHVGILGPRRVTPSEDIGRPRQELETLQLTAVHAARGTRVSAFSPTARVSPSSATKFPKPPSGRAFDALIYACCDQTGAPAPVRTKA